MNKRNKKTYINIPVFSSGPGPLGSGQVRARSGMIAAARWWRLVASPTCDSDVVMKQFKDHLVRGGDAAAGYLGDEVRSWKEYDLVSKMNKRN